MIACARSANPARPIGLYHQCHRSDAGGSLDACGHVPRVPAPGEAPAEPVGRTLRAHHPSAHHGRTLSAAIV